jgi:hypothetical protein
VLDSVLLVSWLERILRKFVVKNEYVRIKPAIEAVKKAKQNLSKAKDAYSAYKQDLVQQQAQLQALKDDCLFVCLTACLFAWLPDCLPSCLSFAVKRMPAAPALILERRFGWDRPTLQLY